MPTNVHSYKHCLTWHRYRTHKPNHRTSNIVLIHRYQLPRFVRELSVVNVRITFCFLLVTIKRSRPSTCPFFFFTFMFFFLTKKKRRIHFIRLYDLGNQDLSDCCVHKPFYFCSIGSFCSGMVFFIFHYYFRSFRAFNSINDISTNRHL